MATSTLTNEGSPSHTGDGVSPLTMGVVGVTAAVATGVLCGGIMTHVYNSFAGGADGVSALVFFGITALVALETFDAGYTHEIPTGWKGVPTFLGKRVSTFLLDEGKYWLPPGLMGAKLVDCRDQPDRSCTITDVALTSDGIEMSGNFFWTYRITNPYRYLSSKDPLKALDAVGQGATKDAIASHTEAEVIQEEQKSKMSETILKRMVAAGEGYGILVTKAVLTQVLPPEEVRKANAQKAVEVAQRESEKIEIENVIERIKELISPPLNFDSKKAYEILAAERGKIVTTRVIKQFELPENVTGIVRDVLERFAKEGA